MSAATPGHLTGQSILPVRARLFRGLSDPSRLAILEVIANGERTVGEIVAHTGLSQSNTSNHLACLLACGLVVRQQRGKFAVYSCSDDRIGSILSLADGLLEDHASRIVACARYTTEDGGR
jgi:DNA-binding transcriptional ArsR family regulator